MVTVQQLSITNTDCSSQDDQSTVHKTRSIYISGILDSNFMDQISKIQNLQTKK